jgi:hypothetical protein
VLVNPEGKWIGGTSREVTEGRRDGGHTVRFLVAAGVVEEGAGLAVELVAVAGGGAGVVEDVAVVLALFHTLVVGL